MKRYLKEFQKDPDNFVSAVKKQYIYNAKDNVLNLIKTAYSAMLFLLSSFHSAIVLDKFMIWSLKNISSFSNTQVLCFFLIIRAVSNNIFFKWLALVWFKRFDFLNIISDLIDRDIQNEGFKTFY